MPDTRLSPNTIRDIEAGFDNNDEAHILLDLIHAEFVSDPTSVQCFDARVVARVARCVALRKRLAKRCLFL